MPDINNKKLGKTMQSLQHHGVGHAFHNVDVDLE